MRRLLILTLVLVLALAEVSNAASQVKPSVESLGRITRLLEDSGYRYSKLSDSGWKLARADLFSRSAADKLPA